VQLYRSLQELLTFLGLFFNQIDNRLLLHKLGETR